jgi:hypothetical protein
MRKETHLKSVSFCAVILLSVVNHAIADESWIKIDYPGAAWTYAEGVSGNNIVGTYGTGGVINHGFLYDGTNWTTLNYPGAISTSVHGIDGHNIVGDYKDSSDYYHGFICDGKNWATLDYPGAAFNYYNGLRGISGNNIVGCYNGNRGFLYNEGNWTQLPMSTAYGTDGTNIVGGDVLYNITAHSLTILDYPGATYTLLSGISGNNIIGMHISSGHTNGFLYDGTSWTSIYYPGARRSEARGISGNRVVGLYQDSSGAHGFIYTIPEPATLTLLGLGAVFAARKR